VYRLIIAAEINIVDVLQLARFQKSTLLKRIAASTLLATVFIEILVTLG